MKAFDAAKHFDAGIRVVGNTAVVAVNFENCSDRVGDDAGCIRLQKTDYAIVDSVV